MFIFWAIWKDVQLIKHMKFKKRGMLILKMDQITQVLYSHSYYMWNIPNIYHVFIVQRGGDI